MQKDYKFRKFLVETLQEIQEKFPTQELVYEDVHYWPILKVRLFFVAYQTKQSKNVTAKVELPPKKSLITRILYFVQTFLQYTYLVHFPKRKMEYLTAGAWAHRIYFNQTWLNRYFVNHNKSRIHFEYSRILYPNIDYAKKSFEAERIFSMFERFNAIKSTSVFVKSTVHKQIIDTFNQRMGLNLQYHFADRYLEITLKWARFWKKILRSIKPNEVRLLCYYGTNMYGLCLASNRLKIPVVDMQHGAQGKLHSAYNFIGNLPKGGYQVLPSHFSVWDIQSRIDLEYAKLVKNESILMEGNPWINYHRQKYKESNQTKKIDILYTLQTGVEVPEFIYTSMEATSDYCFWVLKTHPIMQKDETEKISNRLSQLKLTNHVKIDVENNLLELMLNSKAHVSAFSGSLVEARLLNIPNIIISAIGANTFANQLSEDKNYFKFADTKELFIEHLDNILKK